MGEGSGASEESRIVRIQPRRGLAVSLAASEGDRPVRFSRSMGTDPQIVDQRKRSCEACLVTVLDAAGPDAADR
jgi:hypothetical protein